MTHGGRRRLSGSTKSLCRPSSSTCSASPRSRCAAFTSTSARRFSTTERCSRSIATAVESPGASPVGVAGLWRRSIWAAASAFLTSRANRSSTSNASAGKCASWSTTWGATPRSRARASCSNRGLSGRGGGDLRGASARRQEIAREKFIVLDGGMNHHLARREPRAVIKRNFPIAVLNKLDRRRTRKSMSSPALHAARRAGQRSALPVVERGVSSECSSRCVRAERQPGAVPEPSGSRRGAGVGRAARLIRETTKIDRSRPPAHALPERAQQRLFGLGDDNRPRLRRLLQNHATATS